MAKGKVAVEFPASHPAGGHTVKHYEAGTAEELKNLLRADGVTSYSRYTRNIATYDGTVVTAPADLEELSQEDIAWVTSTSTLESRYILCTAWK